MNVRAFQHVEPVSQYPYGSTVNFRRLLRMNTSTVLVLYVQVLRIVILVHKSTYREALDGRALVNESAQLRTQLQVRTSKQRVLPWLLIRPIRIAEWTRGSVLACSTAPHNTHVQPLNDHTPSHPSPRPPPTHHPPPAPLAPLNPTALPRPYHYISLEPTFLSAATHSSSALHPTAAAP